MATPAACCSRKKCDSTAGSLMSAQVSSAEPPCGVHKSLVHSKADDKPWLRGEVVDKGPLTDPLHNLHSVLIDLFDAAQWSFHRNSVGSISRGLDVLQKLRLEDLESIVS